MGVWRGDVRKGKTRSVFGSTTAILTKGNEVLRVPASAHRFGERTERVGAEITSCPK